MNDFSRNLNLILYQLKLPIKKAASQIGVSANTLSNVLNGNFEPCEKTRRLVMKFAKNYGYKKDALFKKIGNILNVRACAASALCGAEKNAFRIFVQKLENDFAFVLKSKMQNDQNKKNPLFEFRRIIFYKKRNAKQLVDFFENHSGIAGKFFDDFDILSMVSVLGIKIGFFSFGTKKIASLSTSMDFFNSDFFPNIKFPPSIIVNTDSCKTVEKFRYLLAKEFFYQINFQNQSEYKKLSTENLIFKTGDDGADFFVKNILLPKRELFFAFKKICKLPYSVCWKITRLKNDFQVGHELLLRRLFELKLLDYSCKQYLRDVENEAKFYKIAPPFFEGEPYFLPPNFRAHDFFATVFSSAKKAKSKKF